MRGKPVSNRLVTLGATHHKLGIEPGEINKLTTAIYVGIREKTKKHDASHAMKTWKKLLDGLADGFDEGINAARGKAWDTLETD